MVKLPKMMLRVLGWLLRALLPELNAMPRFLRKRLPKEAPQTPRSTRPIDGPRGLLLKLDHYRRAHHMKGFNEKFMTKCEARRRGSYRRACAFETRASPIHCVANGRLRQTGEGAVRPAPPCSTHTSPRTTRSWPPCWRRNEPDTAAYRAHAGLERPGPLGERRARGRRLHCFVLANDVDTEAFAFTTRPPAPGSGARESATTTRRTARSTWRARSRMSPTAGSFPRSGPNSTAGWTRAGWMPFALCIPRHLTSTRGGGNGAVRASGTSDGESTTSSHRRLGCVATSGLRRQDGPPLASTVPGPPSCPATIRSNGAQFEPALILQCVRWYLRYALSYRDLEDMMRERGLCVDHTTDLSMGAALCARDRQTVSAIPEAHQRLVSDRRDVRACRRGLDVSLPWRRFQRRYPGFLAASDARQEGGHRVLPQDVRRGSYDAPSRGDRGQEPRLQGTGAMDGEGRRGRADAADPQGVRIGRVTRSTQRILARDPKPCNRTPPSELPATRAGVSVRKYAPPRTRTDAVWGTTTTIS